jgi:hypothetical protein
MGFFARAVISGFAFSLGKALFDKVKDRIGLGDTPDASQNGVAENVVENIEHGPDSDPTRGPATELESLDGAAN